jgi:lysophospholipase L1-like esterase
MIKTIVIILSIGLMSLNLFGQTESNKMKNTTYSYLALGDSYTIGEGVDKEKNYPHQLRKELLKLGIPFADPKIIAKTGWTTDELKAGIDAQGIHGNVYDLVTLLIGVNNQYRGRSVENYQTEFEELLTQAIAFAGGNSNKVIVVSIPDWGVTPFAVSKGVNQTKVASEINEYNAAKFNICQKMKVKYIDITNAYREYGAEEVMLASDQLHPSAKVYEDWTKKLTEEIKSIKF